LVAVAKFDLGISVVIREKLRWTIGNVRKWKGKEGQ